MKKFVTTVLRMTLPVLMVCGVALWTEWQVFRSSVRKPDCAIGLIGDSRPACGVNEAYFPGLANFAQRASQSMVWRAKLSVILEENPQLKEFIIELSPASYLRMADKPVDVRASFYRGHIPAAILLDIMRTNEMGGWPSSGVARHFVQGVLQPFFCRVVTHSKKSDLQDNYYPLDRNVTDTDWWKGGAMVKPSTTFAVPENASTGVKREVEDSIRLLQLRGIRVTLLTVPFLPYEDDRLLVDGQWPFFESEMKSLCEFYNCKWLNYRRAMPNVEDWADSGHLNTKGAEKFTRSWYGKWKKDI